MDSNHSSNKMMIETDLNNNSISERKKQNNNERDKRSESNKTSKDSLDASLINKNQLDDLDDLLSESRTNSIIDNTPNSTTIAANLLIQSNNDTTVTAIESAVSNSTTSISSQLNNLDHTSPNQSNLIENDDLNFDDNSLTNVTQCFNIKTEPGEEEDNLLNDTASNGSNGNSSTANYSSHVNGPHTNDSIGNSPSSLTLNIKSNGSPVGRQSTSTVNTSSSNSSNSLTNSLANLSSPQTTNTSQANNGQSRTNLVQQLDYSQAFTSANNSSNSGLIYHAAGQLSNQHQTQSTNLNTGQTSIHSTHHSHHSSTTQNATSIFTNTNSHHNSHHSTNSNNNLVIYNNDLPDTKDGLDELCPICMDKVSGYHYGLLTCESCKGFFKRTVQNKKVYNCVADRQCHIDKSQRKRCPYCRFQKCLNVGMKLEVPQMNSFWKPRRPMHSELITETDAKRKSIWLKRLIQAVRADRMRGGRNKFGPMYKRDRARRMQILRQRQQQIVLSSSNLNSSLNSNASNSANNSISISTNTNNSSNAASVAGNLLLAHGQSTNNEPFSLLNPGILYSTDGIKQELIQIPHLSSSTSSPDSSPSPILSGQNQNNSNLSNLNGAAGTSANQNSTNSLNNFSANSNQFSVAATHPELAKWVNGSASSALVGFNAASGSGGVRSLTVGLANSSLSNSLSNNNFNNGLKQANSSFGFIGDSRNANSSALAPSFLANASNSMMLAANLSVVASSSCRLPFVISELQLTAPNDKEWQSNLFSLLNENTYNQCEVDLFDLMCKVIEKNLFSQVDWARNSIFFKELKIDDQMKLLQNSWSHLLVLDHIHQRIHHGLQDESSLPNGQKFNLISLALLGETSTASDMISLQNTLIDLKFDNVDYLCIKFLLLLNPEVKGLLNNGLVQEAQKQTQNALHQYTVACYPQITDKYIKLINELPRLRQLTVRGEEFLHSKHINESAHAQTLLMEMLYAKRK